MFKEIIVTNLNQIVKDYMTIDEINEALEQPKEAHYGDYAFKAFVLSKLLRQSPENIAKNIREKLHNDYICDVNIVSGYLNFFLNKEVCAYTIINRVGHVEISDIRLNTEVCDTQHHLLKIIQKSTVNYNVQNFEFNQTMWPIFNTIRLYEDGDLPREGFLSRLSDSFYQYYKKERILNSKNEKSKLVLLHMILSYLQK